MKTTIEITDELLAEAKAVAHRRGIPLRRLIEDGLRAGIRQYGRRRARFRLQDGSFGGDAPAQDLSWPEVRGLSTNGAASDRDRYDHSVVGQFEISGL